jgi:hypothetical protein
MVGTDARGVTVDRSLSDKAAEALIQALKASSSHERARLMEEALSLHRRAVEAADKDQAGDGPAAPTGWSAAKSG